MIRHADDPKWAKVIVLAMLVTSLIFAVYLYPGPSSRAEDALGVQTSQSAAAPALTPEVVEAVQLHYRRSWLTNLMLLVLGSIGCLSWLRSRRTGPGAWIGLALILGFVTVFLGVVVPANSESLSLWLLVRGATVQRLASIGAWSFVATELHRLLSVTLAVVTAAAMSISIFRTRAHDESA